MYSLMCLVSPFLFSYELQQKDPFIHPLHTKLTKVKEIPYYVANSFMRTYHRDRYQLAQVERMVQDAYENYLVGECNKQKSYRRSLVTEAKKRTNVEERGRAMRQANEFELTRCDEYSDLFQPIKAKR
jgi:hypothetical protein